MEPIHRVTAPTLDVLDALVGSERPVWGLRIIKATGRLAGTVYPILERLERQGWLESSWEDADGRSGPRRRLYEFTTDGRQAADSLLTAARREATSRRGGTTARPVTS